MAEGRYIDDLLTFNLNFVNYAIDPDINGVMVSLIDKVVHDEEIDSERFVSTNQ